VTGACLHSLGALQREYGHYMLYSDYRDKQRRQHTLHKLLTTYFSGGEGKPINTGSYCTLSVLPCL
jgi:predicted HD phosphohydrolase